MGLSYFRFCLWLTRRYIQIRYSVWHFVCITPVSVSLRIKHQFYFQFQIYPLWSMLQDLGSGVSNSLHALVWILTAELFGGPDLGLAATVVATTVVTMMTVAITELVAVMATAVVGQVAVCQKVVCCGRAEGQVVVGQVATGWSGLC